MRFGPGIHFTSRLALLVSSEFATKEMEMEMEREMVTKKKKKKTKTKMEQLNSRIYEKIPQLGKQKKKEKQKKTEEAHSSSSPILAFIRPKRLSATRPCVRSGVGDRTGLSPRTGEWEWGDGYILRHAIAFIHDPRSTELGAVGAELGGSRFENAGVGERV